MVGDAGHKDVEIRNSEIATDGNFETLKLMMIVEVFFPTSNSNAPAKRITNSRQGPKNGRGAHHQMQRKILQLAQHAFAMKNEQKRVLDARDWKRR